MRVSFSLVTFLSLCLLSSGILPSRAQEEGTLRPGLAAETPRNPAAKAPTAVERTALARAQYEVRLRAMMTDFGIEEAMPQNAVIAYLAEDEAGKRVVRNAARRLMTAVRMGAAPERMRDLIAVYKAAIDADGERRRAAQSTLDAKIGFSLSPRLEATLWLLGVLGEGQTGLPLGVLTPRPPKTLPGAPREEVRGGAREIRGEAGAQRGGTVSGVVTKKAEGWIEVRADNGTLDRYLPFWEGGEPRLNPVPGPPPAPGAPPAREELTRLNRLTLETLARVKIGERVSLYWVWSGRKRVVRLEILTPEATPLPPTQKPADAPPAPTYPDPNIP